MIACLIIDDEEPARRQLARLLEPHVDIRLAKEAANGLEAIQCIADEQPDVAFLDIEMPGLSGLEVVAQLGTPPIIVFVTAYDHYAVKAFEANAIDYLLKPVSPSRLAHTLDRVRATLKQPREAYNASLRATLARTLAGPPSKLAAHRGTRVVLLAPKDVLYVVAEDKLVFLCTASERFLVDRTIAEFDALLAPAGFVRISRSIVVNLEHATELIPSSSGTWKVKLSNSVELGVSRERARELKAKIA